MLFWRGSILGAYWPWEQNSSRFNHWKSDQHWRRILGESLWVHFRPNPNPRLSYFALHREIQKKSTSKQKKNYVSRVSGYYSSFRNIGCGKYSSSCSFDRRSLCSKSQVELVISCMYDCCGVFFLYRHHIWNNELGSHEFACPSKVRGVLVLVCYDFFQVV